MAELNAGTVVADRFEIIEEIASGGMGAVYRARQTSLGRQIALKVLHSEVAFTARARRRFGREARAVARLNHPHIASVFDFGTDNDDQTLWLAMELVEGESLVSLMSESIDVVRLVTLTDQILSALSAAHARGIIHRDLKPSNILLTTEESGQESIKLVDFGLAATHSDALSLDDEAFDEDNADDDSDNGDDAPPQADTNRRVLLGTPRYMAPELFRQEAVEPGVDLYALGVILFEILAGSPPYRGDDPQELMRAHLRSPIPRLTPREGDVPPELERCIYQLLAKDRSERFQSAAAVRPHIQAVLNQFSYAPWMSQAPNLSRPGLFAQNGGQTIPPSNLMRGDVSQFGPGGVAQAPLVGRNRERRNLERVVRKTVQSGQGSLAFLEGESGIGKSRLLEWIRVRIQEADVMDVASGSFSRGGSDFEGIRDLLVDVLDTAEVASDDLANHLAEKLSAWNFSTEDAELCLTLMHPGGDSAIFEEGSGDRGVSVQERVFAMIERILRRAGEEKPRLLVLEELHHAGDKAQAFLQHLAVGMHLDPMAVLLVGTLRAEEIEQSAELRYALERLERLGPEHVLRLQLDRLKPQDAQNLVQKLAPVDDNLAAEIATRGSGNPLHISQILSYLQESAKLTWENGGWRLADGVDIQSELPDEIAELMRYRLARLTGGSDDPEATRAILERAAVLGPRFDYDLLRRLLTLEEHQPWLASLDAVLEVLVDHGLFREVGTGGRDVLAFNHLMMRDVLLKAIEERRSKRHLHRLAARAKKQHYGDSYHQRALEFVDHYAKAREPSGVYAYTVRAAQNAADGAKLREAMSLFRDAEALVADADVSPHSPGLDEVSDVLSGPEVALEVAHLERRVGEYNSAQAHYRELLDHSDPQIDLWARWGLGEVHRRRGHLKQARNWYDDTRRAIQSIWKGPNADDVRALLQRVDTYCIFSLAQLTHARGLYPKAQQWIDQGLKRADKLGERSLEARLLRLATDTHWRRGQSRDAEVCHRRAAILEEEINDRSLQAHGQRHEARFLRAVGQPRQAQKRAERALDALVDLDQTHDAAHARLLLGHLAFSAANYKRAARFYRAAHDIFEDFQDIRGVAHCNLALANLAYTVNRYKETQTLVREAMGTLRSIGDVAALTEARLLMGRLRLTARHATKALPLLSDAVEHFQRLDDQRSLVVAQVYLALAFHRTDDADRCTAMMEELLDDLERLDLAHPCLPDGLDQLAEALSDDHPQWAESLRHIRQDVHHRLGRQSSPVSV